MTSLRHRRSVVILVTVALVFTALALVLPQGEAMAAPSHNCVMAWIGFSSSVVGYALATGSSGTFGFVLSSGGVVLSTYGVLRACYPGSLKPKARGGGGGGGGAW